ncbi:hypothetical protein ME1_00543 [Bartonella vinsonii subsp. arupensis OK-94-513]|uniref:Uncharacterized protein n=2 Tax=Bartonella vinsonii subsp. arupensis TaxID=110578 RepID=J0ZJQ9_BARVI|nr:hypothetical protein ME1_00543 [Bartonella vinsonii subsp. arupensis OK-94-513]EJF98069.1 hypothetical protein MEI_00929 [Bartonella vinsonii subsp. arupensis Pm136co]
MFIFTILFGILAFFGLIIITILNSMVLVGIYYFFFKRARLYLDMQKELEGLKK